MSTEAFQRTTYEMELLSPGTIPAYVNVAPLDYNLLELTIGWRADYTFAHLLWYNQPLATA